MTELNAVLLRVNDVKVLNLTKGFVEVHRFYLDRLLRKKMKALKFAYRNLSSKKRDVAFDY
jgi:ribosomal protein L20